MKSKNGFLLLSKTADHIGSGVVLRMTILMAIFAFGIFCTFGSSPQSTSRGYYQSKQTAKHAQTCDMAELQDEINCRDQQIEQHNEKINQIYQTARERAQQRGREDYSLSVPERRAVREARESIDVLKAERNSYSTELSSRSNSGGIPGGLGGGCFTADTKILTEKGYKNIADITVGDKVLTVNLEGSPASNNVVKTYTFTNDHYFVINKKIKVTALHRFYTSNGWIRARDLRIGDRIQMSDGSFEEIVSKELFSADLTVYNLDIADNHNFFVSSDGRKGYLVHNCGGGGK